VAATRFFTSRHRCFSSLIFITVFSLRDFLMTSSRLNPALLARELPARHTTPLPHLARVRLLTGAHLDRLLAHPETTPETTARHRRRIMTRLHNLGLVTTLERKIGGVRAGSAGHIYTLTPLGHRVLAALHNQPCPPHIKKPATPGTLFLAHTLAISDIYVRLIEASRHHTVTMPSFVTEPACWQPTGHGTYLKPDAYCVLSTTTHQDCWWLEIDQNTEPLPRIERKCRAYLDFLIHTGAGPDNVPPRILFTTPDTDRSDAIHKVIIKLSATAETDQLICVAIHEGAAKFLITELVEL
jgi:Replication-relaxation